VLTCHAVVRKMFFHRLSINRPTKRGKEKPPSDGHCQSQKEMDDHLLACHKFLTESHIVTRSSDQFLIDS
jgi:hypothetical protein